jgi:hypothetical protein
MSFFKLKKRADSATSVKITNIMPGKSRNVEPYADSFASQSQAKSFNSEQRAQDLHQNMTINKEIIKTLIDAQNDTGDSQVKKLLLALEKMRVENQQLQDKLYSEE